VVEVRATYDPETAGGHAPDGRKVKTTLHWVSAEHALTREVRNYSHLFTDPFPVSHDDPLALINPESREIVQAYVEPAMADIGPGQVVQFERLAYYCVDEENPAVFHRTVTLKDEWARVQKRA
jgi:glutaminyl-tRNA synthetase